MQPQFTEIRDLIKTDRDCVIAISNQELIKMTTKTLVTINPYLQINNQGQIVNFELTRSQHTLGRDPQLADLCVPDNWQLISRTQATLHCGKMVKIIGFLMVMAKHQVEIDCISIEP